MICRFSSNLWARSEEKTMEADSLPLSYPFLKSIISSLVLLIWRTKWLIWHHSIRYQCPSCTHTHCYLLSNNSGVIYEFKDGIGAVPGYIVIDIERSEQGSEHTALGCLCADDLWGGSVVANSLELKFADDDPIAQRWAKTNSMYHSMSIGAVYWSSR